MPGPPQPPFPPPLVAGGEGFQSRTSRAAAASQERAGDELGGAGPVGGDSGMSRGRDWRSRGGEDEEQDLQGGRLATRTGSRDDQIQLGDE